MAEGDNRTAEGDFVVLAIRRDKLLDLLRGRSLCADDLRCEDCRARDCIRRMVRPSAGRDRRCDRLRADLLHSGFVSPRSAGRAL
ncbi:MAG: hypothetical protein M5U09_09815 [Gammaproteobacteria bacterium]|nr:hypothetical protein [Gammaproteobacteria bacterium]